MINLTRLEQCLQREMPLFTWRCAASRGARMIPNTQIPEEIEITAVPSGGERESRSYLSGSLLLRWGLDGTARLIGHEFLPSYAQTTHATLWGWDKLADM